MLPTIPFCNPPKNPHLHHCLSKEHYFSPSYVGFFGFLCLGQSFHRENRESKNLLTSSLISISFSFLFVFLVSFSLIFLPLLLSFFLSFKVSFFITYLSLSLFLFFITHLLSVFLSTSLFSLSLVFFWFLAFGLIWWRRWRWRWKGLLQRSLLHMLWVRTQEPGWGIRVSYWTLKSSRR